MPKNCETPSAFRFRSSGGLPQSAQLIDIIQHRLGESSSSIQTRISVLYRSHDGRYVAAVNGRMSLGTNCGSFIPAAHPWQSHWDTPSNEVCSVAYFRTRDEAESWLYSQDVTGNDLEAA